MAADNDPAYLTIKEYPILFWIMGFVFLAAGVWATAGALISQAETLIIGLLLLAIGLLFLLVFSTVTTIQADRVTGTLNLRYWSLIRSNAKEMSIAELASVEIESSHSSSSATYRIAFRKKSGEQIPLHSYYSSGYKEKENKARRISEFLGVPGPSGLGSTLQMISTALHPSFEQQQEGESSGVHWTIETNASGGLPITRWSTPDFRFEGSFLFLVQTPQGAINLPNPKWLGSLSGKLYHQVFHMFGFSDEDLPGIEGAKIYDLPKPGLGDSFTAYTNDSFGTQQLITPWVSTLLVDWVRQFPIQKGGSSNSGLLGQMGVLFSPQKLYLITFLSADTEKIDEMIRLGTGLAREAGIVKPEALH